MKSKPTKFTLRQVIKGYPAIVASKKLKGKRGRGTLAEEKTPVLGMIQRNGEMSIMMLPNVQQFTIQPGMTKVIKPGSLITPMNTTSMIV